jgi:hypothetical protein
MENGGELTVLTPFGLAKRCRAVSKASGEQCGKAARRGAEVCALHGLGYGSRVRDGRRTDPRLARLTTGVRAQSTTLDVLAEVDPLFAQARAEALADPAQLFSATPILADLWGLRRLLLEHVRVSLDERGVERPPALLDVLNAILAAQDRVLRMRQRTVAEDAVDARLLNRFMAATVTILAEFVPVEDLDAALTKLRALHAACVSTAAPPQAAYEP